MDVVYRVQQLLRALVAQRRVSQQRVEGAIALLNPRAQVLFGQQASHDQEHALVVWEALGQTGHTSEDLLAAALLHDVGKSVSPFHPWQRAVFTLIEHFAPRALDRATRTPAGGLRHRLWQYARHAEIGAALAKDAGCSPVTVRLILRHEDQLHTCQTEEDRWLVALQTVDDVS